MNISETIKTVIYLPKKFNDLGNVSLYSLLKDSGYFELHDQISENEIRESLVKHPECVNEWMLLSENKRSNTGWYLRESSNEKYEVGCFSPRNSNIHPIEYSDRIAACAAFIKREIENVRTEDK